MAVDEQTVRDLARLALPREEEVDGTGGRLRVRIEGVDVEFRDGHGLVRLDGRVYRTDGPPEEVFAELAVLGRIDGVEVEETSGSLRGRVTLVGLEVKRVGLFGEGALRRTFLEGLAGLNPQILSLLSESLVIPVRLEREVRIRGTGDEGPIRIQPARFPLSARVTGLLAFDRRLWVIVDVSAGEWSPLEEQAEEGGGRVTHRKPRRLRRLVFWTLALGLVATVAYVPLPADRDDAQEVARLERTRDELRGELARLLEAGPAPRRRPLREASSSAPPPPSPPASCISWSAASSSTPRSGSRTSRPANAAA